MSAPGTIRSGVGFRHVQVIPLGSDDYPKAVSSVAYEGSQITGAKALTVDDPEPRDIVHLGDDRVFQRDILPPDTPLSGELRVGKVDDAVDALLGDDLSFTVGEAKLFGVATDSRGDENQVAILAYRQTLDTDPSSGDFGKRRWEGRLFPKCYLVRRESGFEDTPEERSYAVRPLFATKHLWGTSFAAGTEGFTQAQGIRLVSEYKPKIVGFKCGGDGDTEYGFPTATPAQGTGKIVVWVTGVEQTTGFTARTTQVEFSSAPATDAMVVVFYEYE